MICQNCGKNYKEEFPTGTYCFGCGNKESYFIGRSENKTEELHVTFTNLKLEDIVKLQTGWGISQFVAEKHRFKIAVDQDNHSWLYMPIFDQYGTEVHSQLRAWSPGCRKKYLTRSAPAPGMVWRSWTGWEKQQEVAVVEGILDGVRVGEIIPTVALLGHAMNEPRLQTLHSLTHRLVILLDSDALKESLTIAQQFGIINTRVVALPHGDPTDWTRDKLKQFIYGRG